MSSRHEIIKSGDEKQTPLSESQVWVQCLVWWRAAPDLVYIRTGDVYQLAATCSSGPPLRPRRKWQSRGGDAAHHLYIRVLCV